jgi:hypothetical protein
MKKFELKNLLPIVIGIVVIIILKPLALLGTGIIIGALLREISGFIKFERPSRSVPAPTAVTPTATPPTDSKDQNGVSYSQEIKNLVETLRVQFLELFNSEHYGASARRSSEQLFRIIDKFDKFKVILDSKLQKTEMTYDRFLTATEEVYFNVLDNLEKVKNVSQAVEDIDLAYIEQRIETIKNAASMTKEMQDELSSLRHRKSMSKKQIQGIEKILSVNEQAITDIDNMRIKVGNLNTSSNRAQFDIDTSIADLKKMAERVNKYSSDL